MPTHPILTNLSGLIVTGRHIRVRSISGMQKIGRDNLICISRLVLYMEKCGRGREMRQEYSRDRFCEDQF